MEKHPSVKPLFTASIPTGGAPFRRVHIRTLFFDACSFFRTCSEFFRCFSPFTALSSLQCARCAFFHFGEPSPSGLCFFSFSFLLVGVHLKCVDCTGEKNARYGLQQRFLLLETRKISIARRFGCRGNGENKSVCVTVAQRARIIAIASLGTFRNGCSEKC